MISILLGALIVGIWITICTWAVDSERLWTWFNRVLDKANVLADTVRRKK